MFVVMDVGGTHIRYRIIDTDGNEVSSGKMGTQAIGLIQAIESIIKGYTIKKIGISYAGEVHNGVILSAPNIEVDEPNIKAYFLKEHHIELFIENDLKCAALAEQRYWNCNKTMVAASIGTGFGSAIIENGKLFRGSHNLAGEIGHIPYKYSQIPCGCGNHYCIEASCSGIALTRWTEHYRLSIEKVSIQNLRELKNDNADTIINNFEEGLLFAIGTIISLINPELIVLGGGVIEPNTYLLDLINENIHKYALPISKKQTKIVLSRLQDAPLMGAEILIEDGWKG
ncbi:MAG: sugar kinase [Epsilonproteobacteria bacterium]|nr:MAG: sugar kinase [Campylobacterota bacterium]